MFRHLLEVVVFLVGLAVVCWIGIGYVASNPLALAVTLLIGAGYVAGSVELLRYQRATATVQRAVADLTVAPEHLDGWLGQLDPSLRNAVRQRVEGHRVALPGPAITPYLVGLLVLLGMLGTLLGMTVMLRGTGIALETASDLQSIRDSLAAPVKGLGFAFGTSIAGVATSAMLGLLSALCRRARLHAVQQLDAATSTTLRVHSQAHQRDQTLGVLQRQAELMPALIDGLQAMMSTVQENARTSNERQLANQQAFHNRAHEVYAQLATSVEQSLQKSVGESARAASEALKPVMESTMAAVARQSGALQDSIAQAVQRQLQALSTGFVSSTTTVADLWHQAIGAQQQSNEVLVRDLHDALGRFNDTFDARSEGLLQGVSSRLDGTTDQIRNAWAEAMARQQESGATLAKQNRDALAEASATFAQHSTSLLRDVDQSHAALQATLAAQDGQRLALWQQSLASVGTSLREEWARAGTHTAERQQEICDSLARTANDIASRAQAHAGETIHEISRLVDAASQAPRAAAEVVAELRQKLSDSMARDTAMLEERTTLMATLETLLAAVNHASTEQRSAIDALVATSADLLDRVGTRFADHVQAETGKLGAVADQVSVGAVEVASLGDTLGVAVGMFGDANDRLADRLQGIENALERSMARSDEQLAYYVAQAREVIDLSMLTQRQMLDDMQQMAGPGASSGAGNA